MRGTGRFIPARAGNVKNAPASSSVHPRACGERGRPCRPEPVHPRACGERLPQSPRVRGIAHERFIPARAGNGLASVSHAAKAPVHPRACGERGPAVSVRSVRTEPVHPRACGERARACSRAPRSSPRWGRVSGSSPRVRGTVHARHQRFIRVFLANDGSSPRVRGTARVGAS